MPNLAKTSVLKNQFVTLGGSHFFGSFTSPSDTEPNSYDYSYGRRLLKTPSGSLVKPGTLFRLVNDKEARVFLAAEGGAQFAFSRHVYDTFRIFEMTEQLSWTRAATTKDPLTGMIKNDAVQNLGNIWVTIESDRDIRDRQARVVQDMFRLITNAPILEGDKIGGKYDVERADQVLGITVAKVV